MSASAQRRLGQFYSRVAEERAARGRPSVSSLPKATRSVLSGGNSIPEASGGEAEISFSVVTPTLPLSGASGGGSLSVEVQGPDGPLYGSIKRLYGVNPNSGFSGIDTQTVSVAVTGGVDYYDVAGKANQASTEYKSDNAGGDGLTDDESARLESLYGGE